MRSKRRARQRGTAFMETLMVNVVLLPLLGGIVFFQATYSAKIKSAQNARAYAWTYALHGCNTSDIPSEEELAIQKDFGAPNGAMDPPSGDTQSELGNTGNAVPGTGTKLDNDSTYTENVFGTGQGVPGANVGTVNATSSVQIAAYDVLRVQGRVMSSSSHVQCNPTPVSESAVGAVALQAARNLANW